MVILTWQVISRFLPFLPATWTEELARWAFIYMTLLGAALVVRQRGHFGVTIVTSRLHGRSRSLYLRWVVHLPILAAALLFLIFGLRYMVGFGFVRRSPTFHIPMAWLFLALPAAAAPMIVFAAYNVLFPEAEGASGERGQRAGSDTRQG